MFQRCLVARCMPIGVACKTMGFRTPPTTKKDLKKRFVELAKKHHPDQNQADVDAATKNMVKLTEAYTTLKKLLNDGVHSRPGAPLGSASTSPASSDAQTMESVAASFQAPGSSLSLRGFTLPWQRYATSSAMADMDAALQRDDASFDAYATSARAKAKEWQRREARIHADAPLSQGSHGFTAEYFHKVHNVPDPMRDTAAAGSADKGRATVESFWASGWHTSTPYLACRFYGRRARIWASRAPRRAWDAVRFVFHG